MWKRLFAALFVVLLPMSAKADVVVTWQDSAGDLVLRWNGNISGWSRTTQVAAFDYTLLQITLLETGNGMHAVNGPVDVSYVGSTFNWYTGPNIVAGAGDLVWDSFGTSGTQDWVIMPANYLGQTISGSLTFAGEGALIADFHEGSRDLGFGKNDNIVFRAASNSVPEPESLALVGLAIAGLMFTRRNTKRV